MLAGEEENNRNKEAADKVGSHLMYATCRAGLGKCQGEGGRGEGKEEGD